MSYIEINESFSVETRGLSDGATRLLLEALSWASTEDGSLALPKHRLTEVGRGEDPEAACDELVKHGWWRDDSDAWFMGCRITRDEFPPPGYIAVRFNGEPR